VKGGRVTISAGSRDGARAGDTFAISRGAAHVGEIKIADIDRDSSVGAFDGQFHGSGAPPRVGDRATRVNS
jgi:hypothetical protein